MTCPKCGSDHIATNYHEEGCSRESCACSECSYNDHNRRHAEHLHRYCRNCRYDWCDAVLAEAEA